MFRWLQGPGSVFRDPLPGSTNYLNAYDQSGRLIRASEKDPNQRNSVDEQSAPLPGEENSGAGSSEKNYAMKRSIPKEELDDLVPFPMNRQFRSQPVLSDELRDEVWHRHFQLKRSVRVISAELGIEMRRVGAVIRLKAVENEWVNQGKRLATPYARAVLAMLPQTPFHKGTPPTMHESINDLPVHRDTLRQLFHPVSESRHFTRADAGRLFNRSLLPADARVPHPELVEIEKARLGDPSEKEEKMRVVREKLVAEGRAREERERREREREERVVKKVKPEGGRWEFRFRDVSVEDVGADGRGRGGVGARYGIPAQDRKRGQIKIPTRVEA